MCLLLLWSLFFCIFFCCLFFATALTFNESVLKFGLSVVILLAYRVCACLSKQLCISRYRLTNCYRNPANNHQKNPKTV